MQSWRGLDEAAQLFGRGQSDEVPGDEELLIHPRCCVFNLGGILGAAQQQADGRVITLADFVGLPVVEVEVHLAGVAVFERAHLEIDQQVAT